MPRVGRRQALGGIAAGAAGLLTLPRWSAAAPSDLDALAERIRVTPRAGAFALATKLIRSGADADALLGAIFLCGVREIRPRPHGILHSVMMVGSSFQLCRGASPTDAWLLALWNLDSLKESMEDDDREWGNWSLSPPRPARIAEREAARKELVAAMEAWDAPRADAAVSALVSQCDHATLFETLWPLVARCYAFIGHKIIYAMQVERVLGRIGWTYAEPALRSLVAASLVNRDTAAFDRSRELAPTLPDGWEHGRDEPQESAALLGALRAARPRDAQEPCRPRVPRRPGSADGLGRVAAPGLRDLPQAPWAHRGHRSAGAAPRPRHHRGQRVRPRRARRPPRTPRAACMVLQAAGWLTAMRDDLAGLADLSMDGPGIEARAELDTPPRPRARAGPPARRAGAQGAGEPPAQVRRRRAGGERLGASALGQPDPGAGRRLHRQPEGPGNRGLPAFGARAARRRPGRVNSVTPQPPPM